MEITALEPRTLYTFLHLHVVHPSCQTPAETAFNQSNNFTETGFLDQSAAFGIKDVEVK